MLKFTLEAGLCWLLFYTIYYAFLRKETFFKYNRIYLLSTLAIGLFLPSLPNIQLFSFTPDVSNMSATIMEPITITAQRFSATLQTIEVSATANNFNYLNLIILIWSLGTGIALLRFCYGIFKISQLYQKGTQKNMKGYQLVQTKEAHLPFSFLNTLFWSDYYLNNDIEKNKILEHELVHIRKGHSVDNIIIALLLIPFWWMPPLYAYQTSLKIIHEYEADSHVTSYTSVNYYGNLLLQYAKSGFQLPLINSFAFTQLKSRIVMMTQEKSSPRQKLKYLAIIPVLLIMTVFMANTDPIITNSVSGITEQLANDPFDREAVRAELKTAVYAIKDDFQKGNKALSKKLHSLKQRYPNHQSEIVLIFKEVFKEFFAENNSAEYKKAFAAHLDAEPKFAFEGEVFKFVDKMPMFPGCASSESNEELKKCHYKKMLNFIYTNIKYPEIAKEKDIEGTVVARFIVDKEGNVIEPEIVQSIGGGCDEEVLRVINNFPTWIPGEHNGKTVNVYFNLPVKFKLEGGKKIEQEESELATQPRMSGCEDIENMEERLNCAKKKLLTTVYSNIKYPELAKRNGVQGTSILRFNVGVDGKLKNPAFKKFIGGNCEEAVLKAYNYLAENSTWIPATNTKGEAVEAEMVLPVKFKLEEKDVPKMAIQPLTLSEYTLYPNPAQQSVNIAFAPTKAQQITMQITDITGKILINEKLGLIENSINQQIDVSNWTAGNYFVKLIGEKEIFIDQLQVAK